MTTTDGRVRFGPAEWLGLIALAITPAGGFATWGLTMSNRVTVVETVQQQNVRLLARTEDKIDTLIAISVEIRSLEQRIERLENKP